MSSTATSTPTSQAPSAPKRLTRSEFLRAVSDEFGDVQGRALLRDLVLGSLGGLSAQVALDRGVPARDVWRALCEAMDVPEARRHGVGLARPPASS